MIRKTFAGLLALIVVALTLSLSVSVAGAQPTSSADEFGTTWTQATCEARGGTFTAGPPVVCAAFIGDGSTETVAEAAPTGVWNQIQDRAIEWTPTIIVIFAGILIFGFTMLLLAVGSRKALSKLTMLVRRA